MTYTRIAKSHSAWIVVIFLLINFDIFSGSQLINVIMWLILVWLVMSLGVKYQLRVKGSQLEYSIVFLTLRIYKKALPPSLIKSVIFKRTDWSKKKAVIKLKQKANIKVLDYQPSTIFTDLESFAVDHGISVAKTKDYKLLERYY